MNPQMPQQPSNPTKSGNNALPWIMLGIVTVLIVSMGVVFVLIFTSAAKNSTRATSSSSAAKPTAAVTPARNVCEQLTPAVVSQVIGVTVTPNPQATQDNGGKPTTGYDTSTSSCDYQSSDLVTRAIISAEFPSSADYATEPTESYKDIKSHAASSGGSVEPVPGLGDDAYWDSGTKQLSAIKGDSRYRIELFVASNHVQEKTLATSLMRTLLSQN